MNVSTFNASECRKSLNAYATGYGKLSAMVDVALSTEAGATILAAEMQKLSGDQPKAMRSCYTTARNADGSPFTIQIAAGVYTAAKRAAKADSKGKGKGANTPTENAEAIELASQWSDFLRIAGLPSNTKGAELAGQWLAMVKALHGARAEAKRAKREAING